jgi:ankyrin repeat protein
MMSSREQLGRLVSGLQSLRGETVSDDELKQGLMRHILDCVSALGSVARSAALRPTHDEVFLAALKQIIDRNMKISRGETPLESFPSKWIHGQFPGSGDSDSYSWLPLHWCAALSDESDTINKEHLRALLEEDPVDLQLMSEDQEVSPTSLAIAKDNPSLGFINELISIDGSVVQKPDRDGAFALMYACAWNEKTTLTEKLYSLNPKAINFTDAYGFLPLHFACYAGTLENVIFLLLKYPKAAMIKNRAGVLPLLACAANTRRGGVEMARVLIEEYPEAINIPDDEGSLPLHIAAQFSSIDTIKFFYAVNPSAASTANSEGLLPMHFAGLRKEKDIDIVDFLTEANTDAEAAKFVSDSSVPNKEECSMS